MKAKKERHLVIKNLIRNNRISNQDELSVLLAKKGIYAAQATLSRDMTELHISKVHDLEGYFYKLPETEYLDNSLKGSDLFAASIVSFEFSGSVAIIKTLPGHANMIASAIDSAALPEVAGTLAGDDTIFLISRAGYKHEKVISSLEKILGKLEGKMLK